MYDFLSDNNLLSPNQSGFRSGDSCINQFLSIYHEILNAFDKNWNFMGYFLLFQRLFTRYDMMVLFLNCVKITKVEIISNRKQNVVLNYQCLSWVDVSAGVSQRSILEPLLFLIYINDLSDGLKSQCKLFADDTSLFSVVHDINTSASELNEDLEKIGNWDFKWKMKFNPDPNKQAQGIIFIKKKIASMQPVVHFDNRPVKSTQINKYLGMMLDSNLSYEHHIKSILNKVNKTIGLSRKFQSVPSRHSLITIYKTFIRPHLYYGDVIYDRTFSESFR